MLDLQRLRVLSELRRLGTVTAVARSMHFTHSAISQQLASCEKDVGAKLYMKVGRRIRLTQQGELLADYAEKIMALADEAETEVLASTNSVGGRLRITSFQTVLSSILPSALSEIRESFPGLRIEIMQRNIAEALDNLRTGEVDLILGEEYDTDLPRADDNFHRELLVDDPLYLITPTSGPWSQLEFQDLAGVPFAIDSIDYPMGRLTHQLCLRHGFSANVEFETPDPFLHAHLVRTGHAVSLAPRLFLPMLDNVRIAELPGNPTRTLYTAVRIGRDRNPGIEIVRRALKKAAIESSQAC